MSDVKNGYSYTEQERIEVVRDYYKSGIKSYHKYCADKEIGRKTLSRWVKQYGHLAEIEDGHLPLKHYVNETTVQYDSEGKIKTQWIKTKKDKVEILDGIEKAIEELKNDIKQYPPVRPPTDYYEDIATVTPIADAHIGMFACKDVGDPWDLEIAQQYLCQSTSYLLSKAPPCSRAFIFNLGDYLHYHALTAKTEAHGHILDAAGSPQSMLYVGANILRSIINESLKKHQTVVVDSVSGNHDGLLGNALNVMMQFAYENEPRVEVNMDKSMRHYHRFGECFFGLVHGHQTKDPQLPIIMATERPDDWGRTNHRIWFRGHDHHDDKKEYTGCHVEHVRTIAPNDRYAKDHGYLSGRDIKQITFHKKYGRQGEDICGHQLIRSMV